MLNATERFAGDEHTLAVVAFLTRWQCELVEGTLFADGFESGDTASWTLGPADP